jgi:hypothetical protein
VIGLLGNFAYESTGLAKLWSLGRTPIPTDNSEPWDAYPQMIDPAPTDRIIAQGRALVRAIEALGTIEPTGPFERALARLLMAAYKRRLRAIVKVVPA